MRYAQTQARDLAHVRAIVIERESTYIGLDAATRRNLELTETCAASQSRRCGR